MTDSNPTPVRVLVVEDDPTAVALLKQQLTNAPYDVQSAADGPAALRLIPQLKPQIVLLDWMLPGMDGLEVCRKIRAADQRYVHVIMTTIHVEKQRVVEAFEAGVDDFLSKPLDRGELLARLRAATRMIHLHDELARRERRAERLSTRLQRSNQQLKQLAMTDELTGLLNRREATRRLSHAWALAARYLHPLSCAMLDIDSFKSFNDAHGHSAGDALLKAVAETLQQTVRATDRVCRYGGDEFMLFIPHQTAEEAALIAERIHRAVSLIHLPESAEPATVSIGIAARDDGMLTFHDLIDAADRALYHAKRHGKDQTWTDGLQSMQLGA